MPTFMDHHEDLLLPQEAVDAIGAQARAGEVDQYGVRQKELYDNAQGQVYCLLDAPDEQAVRDHHALLGVGCGQVHEVSSIA